MSPSSGFNSILFANQIGGRWTPSTRERPAQPVGAGLKFKCSDEQGAFLFMNVPAESSQMQAPRSIIPLMRTNIEHWRQYVGSKHDCKVTEAQIMLVSGVTKTEDWGLGAFDNGGEASFEARTPFSQVTFKTTQAVQCRSLKRGPRNDPATSSVPLAAPAIEEEPTATSSPLSASQSKRDQTLFFHYYKMKDRRWKVKKRRVLVLLDHAEDAENLLVTVQNHAEDDDDIYMDGEADADGEEVVPDISIDEVSSSMRRKVP